MRYPAPLVEARLLRRYKRFLADVELPGGQIVVAHLANPGSMRTCWEDGAPGRLLHSADPKRKLPWSVEQIQVGGAWIVVNTARGNVVVGEALSAGRIPELAGYGKIERESAYESGGRCDWRLSSAAPPATAWVEVKTATMKDGPRAIFPDSVSERATRHLGELVARVEAGDRAVLLFCVGREDVESVAPADAYDPAYGRALRESARRGVEVLAWRVRITPEGLDLDRPLPVDLG